MSYKNSRSKHPFMVLLGNLLTMFVVLLLLTGLVYVVVVGSEESRARYKRKYPGTTDSDYFWDRHR